MKIKRKKFDSVKMMLKIRQSINKDIFNMTTEEIMEYINTDSAKFEKIIPRKEKEIELQS